MYDHMKLSLIVVREGLFLYEHGVPPYNGGVCHQVHLP